MRVQNIMVLALLLGGLAACGGAPAASPTAAPIATPTAAPTATSAPATATVAPTATIPPTPAPSPTAAPTMAPTPSPVAKVDDAEAVYRAAIGKQSADMGASMRRFGKLMEQPKVGDDGWRVDVAVELVQWQQAHIEAKKLSPPERMKPAHAKYVASVSKFDDASRDMIYFLDHQTTKDGLARGQRAKAAIQEGQALILEAVKLMPA